MALLLDKNENRYGAAPACMEVLKGADPEVLFAYGGGGHGRSSPLTDRLAATHGGEPSRIILGYGCEAILAEAIRRLEPPGLVAAVPSPAWWYYTALLQAVGASVVTYPLVETETTYPYDQECLASLPKDTALLLIASPNNPTGNSFPWSSLVETLERFWHVTVILDRAYWGLIEGEDRDGDLVARYPNLLVLRTFSKLYGLAGVRIGYALALERLADPMGAWTPVLGYNRLSELIALAALDSPDYYRDIRRRMGEDKGRFIRFSRAIPGVRPYESDANFVLVRLPDEVRTLLEDRLEEAGIRIKFLREPGLQDCARISLGTTEETTRLLDVCARILGLEAAFPGC